MQEVVNNFEPHDWFSLGLSSQISRRTYFLVLLGTD